MKIKLLIVNCSLLIALCACGFSPMHATRDNASSTRDIFIAPISGTNGVDLRNALRAKMNAHNDTAANAKYTLTVDLKRPETIFKALQITGDATWQEVRMTANYILTDADGNKIVSATDTASESYTFVRDLVAANASYNSAVQSTIRILSEKISTRVTAKLVGGLE